jgi:lipopolysaccharide biosynthesis glycosyltransferase
MDNDLKVFIPKFEFVNKNMNLSNHLTKRALKHKIINNNNKIIILIFLFLLIIIINLFYLYQLKLKNINNIKKYYNEEYELGNHSIYKDFYYPQISIILLKTDKLKYDKKALFDLLINLKKQKLKDIQIIASLTKSDENIFQYNISKKLLNDNRIDIYQLKSIYLKDNIYDIINKVRGKFILIMTKFFYFEKNELFQYYNYTKGKIKNIFSFKTKHGNNVYLIKTKKIKDILESNLYFKNVQEIINYIISLNEPKLNYISLAFALNDYYSPSAYVAMTSILHSKDYYTYISFYLIIPKNFKKNNKDFLLSLYDQYDYFNITFLEIDERYNKAFVSRYLTKETYYRFSLGELIPYLNKIIYLDTDIIAYRDLTNLYNLNFNGKIILGQLSCANKSPKTGIYNINNGLLLLNLDRMRQIKMEKKVLDIINKGYKNKFHDQGLINQYFYKYIGIIPPEYNTRPFKNYIEAIKYNKDSGNLYDNDHLFFSWLFPSIRHYLGYSKPIHSKTNNKNDWWYFASKSKYFIKKTNNYNKIFNFSGE